MTGQMPPARRAVAGPLVLALVFLAVIGGSAGAVLGLRADRGSGGADAGDRPGNGGVTGTAPQSQPAGDGTTPATQPPTAPATPGRACPAVTEQAAKAGGSPGGLTYVLYIRTDQSQVWICKDTAGRLWYQGHRHLGSPTSELPAPTSDNTLFLADVAKAPGEGYVATNTGRTATTYYRVSATWLVIDYPGADNDSQEKVLEYDIGPA
ncbi:MAG TPA: hypothetical protein VFB84_13180 [Micromonosporaceae bacterium]|nr:hypothetical protein [Micromonosporaceae bacterium]